MPPRRPQIDATNAPSPSSRVPTTTASPGAAGPDRDGVRLARRAGSSFSPRACMLGFGYFARGAVELARVTDTRVEAIVRGKRTHEITLTAMPDGFGELRTACTCTPTSLGTTPCRHLWAAILEADRQGALPCLRRSSGVLVLSADEKQPATAKEPTTATPTAANKKKSNAEKTSATKKKSATEKPLAPKKARPGDPPRAPRAKAAGRTKIVKTKRAR